MDASEHKELGILYFDLSSEELSPHRLAMTINTIKQLEFDGYSKEDIRYAIVESTKTQKIWSFGYVFKSIESIIAKKRQQDRREAQRKARIEMERHLVERNVVTKESEVGTKDDASERNRRKAQKLSVQSRERKKSYFDLFER